MANDECLRPGLSNGRVFEAQYYGWGKGHGLTPGDLDITHPGRRVYLDPEYIKKNFAEITLRPTRRCDPIGNLNDNDQNCG